MLKAATTLLGLMVLPTIALGQVGPNPAVPNGSQSPSIGGSTDIMTAPQDARIGARASGNVLDRTVDTRTGVDAETEVDRAGPTAGTGTSATTTGTAVSTETRTTTRTKAMRKRP